MRKINQYKTTYYKEVAAVLTVLFLGFMYMCPIETTVYVREETVQTVTVSEDTPEIIVVATERDLLIQRIRETFPRNADVMVAVAKAESHLNPDAVGYNCYYNKDETIVYSTYAKGSHSASCKKGHAKYAWSVDCGLLQRNYLGKSCPEMTLDDHLKDVQKLSRIQGLEAWSAYKNGSYKKYLAQD